MKYCAGNYEKDELSAHLHQYQHCRTHHGRAGHGGRGLFHTKLHSGPSQWRHWAICTVPQHCCLTHVSQLAAGCWLFLKMSNCNWMLIITRWRWKWTTDPKCYEKWARVLQPAKKNFAQMELENKTTCFQGQCSTNWATRAEQVEIKCIMEQYLSLVGFLLFSDDFCALCSDQKDHPHIYVLNVVTSKWRLWSQ